MYMDGNIDATTNQKVPYSQDTQITSAHNKKNTLLKILLVIVFLAIAGFIWIFITTRTQNISTTKKATTVLPEAKGVVEDFFKTGVNNISLPQVKLNNLPNTKDVRGVAEYKGHVWLSGDGSIVEFDPSSHTIVRYSDPTQANCDSNLVIINSYLYVPCHMYGALEQKDENDNPVYGIYKINLKTFTVEKVFTNKDGLRNQQNYRIYADDSYVWIGTFEGVGRIDTRSDTVVFFQNELGISGTHFSISTILVDKDYVWVYVTANTYSTGGVALYNKETQTWTPFGPKELKMDSSDNRIDLDWTSYGYAIKKIPGGIQIAFPDGENETYYLLGENQYFYATGEWEKLPRTLESSGPNSEVSDNYLQEKYLPDRDYTRNDEKGFAQIYDPKTNKQKYIVNGRAFLAIYDMVNSKRYLITSSSIDVLTQSAKLPKIVLETGRDIDTSRPRPTETDISFHAPKKGSVAFVVDVNYYPGFEGPDYWGTMRIWAFDITTDTVLKDITSDTHYAWRQERNFEFLEEGNMVFLTQEGGKKILSFDTIAKTFIIIDTNIAS